MWVRSMARVTNVEHLGGLRLRLTFTDRLVRELDFTGTFSGVLADLADESMFGQVSVDPEAGTITWPNGVDLDPDVLHGDADPATGSPPRVLTEYRLQATR